MNMIKVRRERVVQEALRSIGLPSPPYGIAPRMQASKTRSAPTGRKSASPRNGRRALSGAQVDRTSPGEAAHIRAYGVLKEAVLAGHFRPGEVVTLRSL